MSSPESLGPNSHEMRQFMADFGTPNHVEEPVDPRLAGDFVYEGSSLLEVPQLDSGKPAKQIAVASADGGKWSLQKSDEQPTANGQGN